MIVIGAGIVGTACAEALTRDGLEVVVVDRLP
ncbi:MAG: FAD-dependent oxidoreductase, partial [Terracoccus sp.]